MDKDSLGTFFELLILVLWVFGARFFRAMQERNNRRVEAAAEDAPRPVVVKVPLASLAAPLPTRVDTVDELAALEDALEEEFGEESTHSAEELEEIRLLLQDYDASPYAARERDPGEEPLLLAEKKAKGSLSAAASWERAREAVVLGEILGSPRAHCSFFRERRALGAQRKRGL